jgi:hypothetical protein
VPEACCVLTRRVKCCGVPARRFEMGQLQERHDHAERDLAAVRHDIGTLTAERDHLANQVGGCVGRSSGCGCWHRCAAGPTCACSGAHGTFHR